MSILPPFIVIALYLMIFDLFLLMNIFIVNVTCKLMHNMSKVDDLNFF